MATLVNPTEMHDSIQTGSKRTVQPTTSLTDKFRSTFRNISLTLRRLDVGQVPLETSLSHKLETQNTIFSKEHVLFENVHTLDTLLTKLLR